jgi:hypothetical protein
MAREGLAKPTNVPDVTIECPGVDRDDAALHLAAGHVSDGVIRAGEGADAAGFAYRIMESGCEERAVGNAGDVEVIHEKPANSRNSSRSFSME